MAFGNAEALIKSTALAAWTRPEFPLFFPNEMQTPPTNGFAYLEVICENENIAAFGGGVGRNEWECSGRVEIVVHVPLFSGLVLGRTIRDDLCAIFRGKRFAGLSCYGAGPFGAPGRSDKGNFYTLAAVVDFTYRFVG